MLILIALLGVFSFSAQAETASENEFVRLKLYEHGQQQEFLVSRSKDGATLERNDFYRKPRTKKLADLNYSDLLTQRVQPLLKKLKAEPQAKQNGCRDSAELSWSLSGKKGKRIVCLEGDLGKMVEQLASRMDSESLRRD